MIPKRDIEVISYTPGTYERGKWQQGQSTTRVIRATVQPINGKELQELQENEDIIDATRIYSKEELKTADIKQGIDADEVIIDGDKYKVIKVEKWHNNIRNHYKAIVARYRKQ